MKILVLGGTVFLSKAITAEAVRRGHDVVCAARGASGGVPEGAALVQVDRDRPGAFDALAGERFDSVIDVSKYSVNWVRDALEAFGSTTPHWTFVSSISVYADHSTGSDELLPPLEDDPAQEFTAERYGSIKVASEIAVREAVASREFIVRAGLITGPDDPSDRFGYWPARMAQGGRVVVPDSPDLGFQHIDARDLAQWIVFAAEERVTGTYDSTGPVMPFQMAIGEIAGATAPAGTQLVPVPESVLKELNVNPWAGPRSLPLWLPQEWAKMVGRDVSNALANGLRVRPLAETALDSLKYERGLGLDRPRKAGLTQQEEQEILTAVS
ncbi:NAD-dependent epimerase/dehydratase family protein [Lentzea sp. BCCO 10_0061]|uniref:NAD-dependent epimerase/dehydratase family protein n=1 Tax=Lentzea sokolovensis TaxID=3095429 RepID=A0ABU4UY34_9PSEU|nr:NAD-dependent epimerase/dehydratase family protein [Lentzea sp. BCCO 10_0061]MDX8144417.1 NAD-dependent epimerase/dehydratase family protein [Lentzea sp. BCCO 10_0061]